MKKIKKYVIVAIPLIIFAVIAIMSVINLLFAVIGYKQKEKNKPIENINYNFLPAVKELHYDCWLTTEYLRNSGDTEYIKLSITAESSDEWVNYQLAIIQCLTNGVGSDVFALDGSFEEEKHNFIYPYDYVSSYISRGVHKFFTLLLEADAESFTDSKNILIALQAYVLGEGYIAYAQENGGYSSETASAYAELHAIVGKDPNFATRVNLLATSNLEGSSDFIYPLLNYKTSNSPFGTRIDPITGAQGNSHNGTDFAAPKGTEIRAIGDGVVVVATQSPSWGNYVRISHNGRVDTLYAHASELLVSPNQNVKKGDVIAKVGSTGRSTGNHLHLELYLDGIRVDPEPYMSRSE